MTFVRRLRLSLLSLLFVGPLRPVSAQWIEAAHAHFSVFYQSGYAKDADSIAALAESTEKVMLEKYGVIPARYRMSIYLHPVPTKEATVDNALNRCCKRLNDSVQTGTIDMLAPSSPAMQSSAARSSLGMHKNSWDYSAKVLVSEYIPIGHYEAQRMRPTGGWMYYDAPNWFVQGLQEYDAIFHSTARNRDSTSRLLSAWARAHQSVFSCCSPSIAIADDYNGGATFMVFLASRFGEAIHARLLRSAAPTFVDALAAETKMTPAELNAALHEWLLRQP